MRQDLGSTKRSALWRRRLLAAGVVGVFHAAIFGVIVRDWALHRAPARLDAVEITLERPLREQPKEVQRAAADRPEPPPPPPPPPLSETPQGISPNVRVSPQPGEAPATPVVANRGTSGGGEERAGGALNLGCLTPNLPKKQREECDRKATVAYLEQPRYKRKEYEPSPPASVAEAKKSPEPGLHWSLFPPGLKLVVSPNDKGFPPGLGDTKTTVFEPAEIYDVPPAMR